MRHECVTANDATHNGRSLSASNFTITYIQEFEAELLKKLEGGEDTAAIVRWISEKVLESYRNGIAAGQKGKQVIRKGKSRRHDIFGKTE